MIDAFSSLARTIVQFQEACLMQGLEPVIQFTPRTSACRGSPTMFFFFCPAKKRLFDCTQTVSNRYQPYVMPFVG